MTDLNGEDTDVPMVEEEEPEPEPEVEAEEATEPEPLSEQAEKFVEAGLSDTVARRLDEVFLSGSMTAEELDDRALEALKEIEAEGAIQVLEEFSQSDLSHVQNKSAFLCGVMKTYRQRLKAGGQQNAPPKGPDEEKIKEILDRTGYPLDVTTGQRKYGPPPGWEGDPPSGYGYEVFVGKIPKEFFEDEIIPMFEDCGKIYDLRLMMDPQSGYNRGYAFITFCEREGASKAVDIYNNYEIQKGRKMGVCLSVAKCRLFVGSIPKHKTKEEIREEFEKILEGIRDVIIYHMAEDKAKNRGFCFLDFDSHLKASQARRKLSHPRLMVFGNKQVTVDWADPLEEPDQDVMSKVKVLYIRNLNVATTEEKLTEIFTNFGELDRVKKLKDYAFVHFKERDPCVQALEAMNRQEIEGEIVEISLAKPLSEEAKKKRSERRQQIQQQRTPAPSRDIYGGYDYGYDYYSQDYYRGGYDDPYYAYHDYYAYDAYYRPPPPPPPRDAHHQRYRSGRY